MLFLGDIHGSFSHLLYTLARLERKNLNIVQVGDFGLGFLSPESTAKNLSIINEALKTWDSKLYIMRGNHDDPDYFKGKIKDMINEKFKHIVIVEDYEVHEIEGKKVLFVGGGVSVDRTYREKGRSYWEDEVVVYSPEKIKDIRENNESIDIIVTHSAPTWCFPVGFDSDFLRGWFIADENLKQDLIDEREMLGNIFDELNEKFKFKYHIYGHFHKTKRKKIVDTEHILLGINEFLDLDKLEKLKKEDPENFD